MKQFLLLLCLPVLLIACSSNNNPRSVAESFSQEVAKGNYDKATKYCTADAAAVLKMIIDNAPEQLNSARYQFKYKSENIEEDKATVFYQDGNQESRSINLILVEGKWKILPVSLFI